VDESSESHLITIAAIVKPGNCDCSTYPQNENRTVSTYCPNISNCPHLTILLLPISSPLLSHSLSFPPWSHRAFSQHCCCQLLYHQPPPTNLSSYHGFQLHQRPLGGTSCASTTTFRPISRGFSPIPWQLASIRTGFVLEPGCRASGALPDGMGH
jgi:hypothetical protein